MHIGAQNRVSYECMQFEIVFTNICRLNTPSGHYNTKTPVPRIESGSHA